LRGWNQSEILRYVSGRKASPADDRAVEILRESDRILELGCGPGLVAGRLKPDFMVCSDISPGFLAVARVNAPASTQICADPLFLPFGDAAFDAVLAMAVLHHIEPDLLPGTLRESRRVIEPGGFFLLVEDWAFTDPTPIESKAMQTRFSGGNHEYHLSWNLWDRLFEDAGFRLAERSWPARPFDNYSTDSVSSDAESAVVRMMAAVYERSS
jgi:SAM-dependent methyltransferase